ncbi:PREDICTED: sperm-associated antigen 11-like [Miniopterus natalensis]|uniref:sperm-associated antigen 11-like n=1 Tax=Miniopterus natalensis TaxID=291302 RepID=UPI0007A6B966|nr:PREDICTED: sperm-associated antigen 11-like [Miniopterus natalensis]
MERLLSPRALLLVALLLPGLSRARYVNHEDTEGTRAPREESHGQGPGGSHALRHEEKRRLLPRTVPYLEKEADIKVVNCKRSEGKCQEYCNYMEIQVGHCPTAVKVCCVPQY